MDRLDSSNGATVIELLQTADTDSDFAREVREALAAVEGDTDGWWTIEVPELTSTGPNGATIVATGAATTWRGIEKAAHELVAAWLDVDEGAVALDVEVVIPNDIAELWKESSAAESEGRAAMTRAAALRRDVVRALRAEGYPLEAAAAALGVSRQRVQQLEKATA